MGLTQVDVQFSSVKHGNLLKKTDAGIDSGPQQATVSNRKTVLEILD